jgi:tRNA nucleotidyltransferase (CCA-adding enzyme)
MNQKDIFKKISKVAEKTSTQVFVVGGYVRDLFLYGEKDENKDIDFVVIGSGVEFAKKFDESVKQEGRLVLFEEFDTARYLFFEENTHVDVEESKDSVDKKILFEIEFAGARSEKYSPKSRKPKVVPTNLEQDLSRRDFTVNAMALPVDLFITKLLDDKEAWLRCVDPFNGRSDLAKKILKTPLDPDETFSDDPLRMMRAARFASQLDFSIEENTLKAMHKNAKRLKIVSAERIQEELFKMLSTKKPSVGLQFLYCCGLFDIFLPEVSKLGGVEEVSGYSHKDNLSHTFAVVDNIAEQSDNVLLRFAGLVHDIAKPYTKKFTKGRGWTFDMHEHLGRKMARDIGKKLRMKKKDIEYIAKLVRWHLQPIALMDEGVTDSAVRRLIVNGGNELFDLLILCRSDITTGNQKKKEKRLKNYEILDSRIREVIEKDKMRAFQSPVRGEEIMELCSLAPGPTVGKIKKAIEEAILDGKIPNEYEPAKEYFEKIKANFLKQAEHWELLK